MRPIKMCISAWGPYKEKAEIDFTRFYGQGLFLITGATGAGKTTIFDAITYALYGALSGEVRDKERSSVRSDFADAQTPTYVELTMEHGGNEYFIRRNPEYFRPKKRAGGGGLLTKEKENALLQLPDGKVIEGVREVNGKLQELMGVDLQQFKQLSMIAQGEFTRLLNAPPKEKTKIFREIFGTGIYERFTYNLSKEAKKRYQKVAEHKAKLDEDLRILTGSLKNMDVAEALKEEFATFPELAAVPFDKVSACLEAMEQELSRKLADNKRAADKSEKSILKKQAHLTFLQEENKRIQQYRNAAEEQERLEEQREAFAEKEKRYREAIGASLLEGDAVKLDSVKVQLRKMELANKNLKEGIEKNREFFLRELPVLEQREEISLWIGKKQEYQEKKAEEKGKKQEFSSKEKRLTEERLRYATLEKQAKECKDSYEEALRKRSYAAIGIAAQLLEEGKPCPVCGSLEHPRPAPLEEHICSEEEVESLKELAERAGKQAELLYGQVLELQTETAVLERQLRLLAEESIKLQSVVEEGDNIPEEFTVLPCDKALKYLQEICDRVNSLQATLRQQELQLKEGQQELEALEKEYQELNAHFQEKLKIHGFADMIAYEAAYLEKMERDALQLQLEEYREQLAGAKQLCKTLREHITGTESLELSGAEQELSELLDSRKYLTAESRNLEYSRSEVKRCRKQLAEKESIIRSATEEYGFIKELENIASGNNPKRLVFEQYVLASYFDEILKAANIRFRKMSSGRYEMHRAKEVSDGRSKDNLEIEVMDYYTGKPRSVRTLSGGESFKASLSLALGLSDVIQSMSGGIKVDTLFIDEGFGALDSESLDQACNTLNALVENNRLIGIISHVPELRERIMGQLVIHKGGSGSDITIVT